MFPQHCPENEVATHPVVLSLVLTAAVLWEDTLFPTPQVPVTTETPFRTQRAAQMLRPGAGTQVLAGMLTQLVVAIHWAPRVCERGGSSSINKMETQMRIEIALDPLSSKPMAPVLDD